MNFSEWRGDRMKDLRRRRNWSQADLASKLGVTASWVSQVEKGPLVPTDDRREQLALLLGDELRGSEPESLAENEMYACLWRARADLLSRVSEAYIGSSNAPRRKRLRVLSKQLLAEAARHPQAARFTVDGGLAELQDFPKRNVPTWIRRLVAVEVAGMVLDAPVFMDLKPELVHEKLDVIVDDLDVDPDGRVHRELVKIFSSGAVDGHGLPTFHDLPCFGGKLGDTRANLADPSGRLSLLLGHDPVGWCGIDYVAGRWLMPPYRPDDTENDVAPEDPPLARSLASTMGLAGAAKIDIEDLIGTTLLGPILGVAVGSIVASLVNRPATRDKIPSSEPSRPNGEGTVPGDHNPDVEQAKLDHAAATATLCQAFGRAWLRHELAKVIAMYRAFDDWAAGGDDAACVPPAGATVEHFGRVQALLAATLAAEKDAGGASTQRQHRLAELEKVMKYAQLALASK